MSAERKSREWKRGDDECRERIMNGVLSVGSLVIVFVCLIKRKASDNRVNMNLFNVLIVPHWYYDILIVQWSGVGVSSLVFVWSKEKWTTKGEESGLWMGRGGWLLSKSGWQSSHTPDTDSSTHQLSFECFLFFRIFRRAASSIILPVQDYARPTPRQCPIWRTERIGNPA